MLLEGKYDFSYLYEKYKQLGLDKLLREPYPFVIQHRNIIEYINGVNPILSRDSFKIRKGERAWERIKGVISMFATGDEEATEDKRLILLGMYNDKYLVADIIPRMPYVPSLLCIAGDNIICVERKKLGNIHKIYIEVLRNLVNGVIVKV